MAILHPNRHLDSPPPCTCLHQMHMRSKFSSKCLSEIIISHHTIMHGHSTFISLACSNHLSPKFCTIPHANCSCCFLTAISPCNPSTAVSRAAIRNCGGHIAIILWDRSGAMRRNWPFPLTCRFNEVWSFLPVPRQSSKVRRC